MAGENKRCIVCGKEAIRSVSALNVASVLREVKLLSLRGKVGLCRDHYKLFKKKSKLEREATLSRMKDLFR